MSDRSSEDDTYFNKLKDFDRRLRESEDKNKDVEDYKGIILYSTKSTKTKELGAELIPKYFKFFTDLSKDAFSAYKDIIDQVDGETPDSLHEILELLVKYLNSEEEEGKAREEYIKASLSALFKLIETSPNPNKVLSFIRDEVFPQKEKLLKPQDEMERHITDLIKKTLGNVRGQDFFNNFIDFLKSLTIFGDGAPRENLKEFVEIVQEQAALALKVVYTDRVKRFIACLQAVFPLFTRGAPHDKFVTLLITYLGKVDHGSKLLLLRALCETAPHTTPEVACQMLPTIVQQLQIYMMTAEEMNLRTEDMDIKEICDMEERNFTCFECLLYMFHQLASKDPDTAKKLCGDKVEDYWKLNKEFTDRFTNAQNLTENTMETLADKMKWHLNNLYNPREEMQNSKTELRACNNILAMTKVLQAKTLNFIKDTTNVINLSWKELRKPSMNIPCDKTVKRAPERNPQLIRLLNFGRNLDDTEVVSLLALSKIELTGADQREGRYFLSDVNQVAILGWQMREEDLRKFVMNKLQSRKDLMGGIRDQMYHLICWSYAASDLVSGMRVKRKWESEFIPLCTWYLSTFSDPLSLGIDEGLTEHICYSSTIEKALIYIQEHGIPKELVDKFDCKDLEPPSVDEPWMDLRSITGVRKIETMAEALEELKKHPIGADLIEFEGMLERGEYIYYGPKTRGAAFKGYHSVIMLSVEEMNGEVVVVCKLSNGTEPAYGGYLYVSLSTLYIPVGVDGKWRENVRGSCQPMHLLSNFIAVDMDENVEEEEEEKKEKEKEKEDKGEEEDKKKEDEEEKEKEDEDEEEKKQDLASKKRKLSHRSGDSSRSSMFEILAYVSQVDQVILPEDLVDHENLTVEQIESNTVRCPNPEYAEKMIAAIDATRTKGNSVGGVVTCIVRNAPRELGSLDKLEAELAKACMSLPATKGFEFGSGFSGTLMTGLEHNDEVYTDEDGRVQTRANRSGGIQGGVSNGEIINMRVTFEPTSTIARKQTGDKQETDGGHDPCVVPRDVPMVKAVVASVLMDQLNAQRHSFLTESQ